MNSRATLPIMRKLLLIASILVFLVGIPLFLVPTQTATYFAWTINPPLTAAFLGAAYWSSLVLEYFSSRETSWVRARVAIPAVLSFTALTAVATFKHLDKFHLGDGFAFITQLGTWGWLAVYVSVPIMMSLIWWQQSQVKGNDEPRTAPIPSWFQWLLYAEGGVLLVAGLLLFIVPTTVASWLWAWPLSALTGRAIGAWLIGLGVANVHSGWEGDWHRIKNGLKGYFTFALLELIALLRFATATNDTGATIFQWGAPAGWIYVLFLGVILATGAYGWQQSRKQS